jgi:isopentenyl-diphosphate Delta-isomerase
MKITIVDENDNEIGTKERTEITSTDIYRVSAAWIVNSKGEVLLAQRSYNKKNAPGQWGPAVAGTVEDGETYQENIIKEMEEELGVKNVKVTIGPKILVQGKHTLYTHYTQWFTACLNKTIAELSLDKNEVEKVAWLKKDELLKDYKNNPDKYIPSTSQWINLFCK